MFRDVRCLSNLFSFCISALSLLDLDSHFIYCMSYLRFVCLSVHSVHIKIQNSFILYVWDRSLCCKFVRVCTPVTPGRRSVLGLYLDCTVNLSVYVRR